MRVLAHQLLDALLVLARGFLDAGADELQPRFLQRRDHRPGFHAAGDEQNLLALEARLVFGDRGPGVLLLARDQLFGALHQLLRRAALDQQPRDFAQGIAGILDAVERALEERNAVALLHLARDIDHRLGADHHRRAGAMRRGDLVIAAVAGNAGQDADAEFVEQRLHLPQLAGEIEFADDVDVVGRGVFRLDRADDMVEQGFARELVAEVLRPDEARRIDRDHRLAEFFRRRLADRVDVVADHRRHAGLIDEDRRRIVFLDDLAARLEQALLAAEHDVGFIHVGGEAGAPQIRSRTRRRRDCPSCCPRRRSGHERDGRHR